MPDKGAPTKFKNEYIELGKNYCLLGATNDKLGELFGVCTSTIDNWLRDIPDFLGAIKEGREIADSNVAKALYDRAVGYSHKDTKFATFEGQITDSKEYDKHYPPDTKACEFWLKNRQPKNFREKQEIEHSGEIEQVLFYVPENGTEAKEPVEDGN